MTLSNAGDPRAATGRKERAGLQGLLLLAIALGTLLLALVQWVWPERKPARERQVAQAVAARHAASPAPPTWVRQEPAVAAPEQSARPRASGEAPRKFASRCVQDGVTTYSDRPCPPQALVQERLPLDPGRNLADGLLRSQVEATVAAADPGDAAGPAGAPVKDAAQLHRLRCEAIDARVRAIDEQSGHAQPGEEAGRLASLRREYRDELHRLQC